MNILLSAYACEPNKGSEPGVGWNWAIEIAKHHNVWIITRDNNEPTITAYLRKHPEYKNENLHFIYVGLSKKLTFWKKGRRGMRLFYMIWQRKAARVAMNWNKKVHFDIVQHITFVSYTQPTYMYKLGVPMIWGPISGGENVPKSIKIKMTPIEKFVEFARKLSQYVALATPSIRKTMEQSKYILVATEETRKKIPNKYQNKIITIPAIGIEKMQELKKVEKKNNRIRIIMAGRLIYWKAFDIGLKAFLQIADLYPDAELHILGEGNKKESLKKLAGKYLGKQVFFEKLVAHDKIFDFYQQFDIFVNTTLRDSGCMTMMEAMSVGLPCVCIATGGPEILSSNIVELQIGVSNYDRIVNDIKYKLIELIENKNYRDELSLKSRAQSERNMYCNKYLLINRFYNEMLN